VMSIKEVAAHHSGQAATSSTSYHLFSVIHSGCSQPPLSGLKPLKKEVAVCPF
jgi:hypothetical protein